MAKDDFNKILPLASRFIAGKSERTVSARALHEFLQVGRDFSTWIKSRISEYGFVENEDYVIVHQNKKTRGRNAANYFLTLDTAKELAMVERNEQGREARRYFIECEKRLKEEMALKLEGSSNPMGLEDVRPLALPDKTMKHWWLTMNSSGQVLQQVELKNANCVSEKVDEVFPDAVVMNRLPVIDDIDSIVGYMHQMTASVQNRLNGLISVLGTPTNATQADADEFWRKRARRAAEKLSEISMARHGGAV